MGNFGVSPRIHVGGENSKTKMNTMRLSPVYGESITAKPPVPNTDGTPSEAMLNYWNKYRDFAFQKITPPDYSGGSRGSKIPSLTGVPGNEPDLISDVHFIGIMRSIDDILRHRYKGTIIGTYDTPKGN